MRMMAEDMKVVMLVFMMVVGMVTVEASDPSSIEDFCIGDIKKQEAAFGYPCKDTSISSKDFKSSLLKNPGNTSNSLGSALTLAYVKTFPALNGQGVSFARIDYAKGGVVQPHLHPRASEVIFVLKGALMVGFADTQNKLYSQKLSEGEMFVFPRAMVHYIANAGSGPSVSLSALDSQNPGAVFLAKNLFASQPSPLPDNVLTSSFKISPSLLHSMEASLSKS
eukprot:TRINITY_DN15090_c0_g1_i1.p1 TRINITY_DN15090_c0_g1~~TRINITY_DN15090_c0_g1_i1.p1  ORF type:complete len:223 (+),score=42.34 TRINITY_DN15090_c0_g1_i1:425-1093(+)